MTLEGIVKDGVIVLDEPEKLPEGARVTVVLDQGSPAEESLRELLLRFAGSCPGLPADMAEQHDRYIHRTAKK